MNTTTLQETNAIANAVATLACGHELRHIPLSKLRPSSRNVRPNAGASIPELAASIFRLGLLQNLNVVISADGEHYEVVAGRRRLAALKLLVKQRKFAKDIEIPCLVVSDDDARTVSLTENVQREAMHPGEQFEAFAKLVAEGRPIEDIAADFGVTPLVVQRRMKLANVSPRLLADYKADTVTLEQLMALAITDDHAAQEAAFYDSPRWQRGPEQLRAHLTREEIDASRDVLAKFVGVEAYEQAGGAVRRDLFADDQNGIFLTDAGLLESLAKDRLAEAASKVQAEGWGWVDVAPRATSAELQQFQRIRSQRREPSKAEVKRIDKIETRQDELQERLEGESEDMPEEQVMAAHDELDALENELETIERSLVVFPGETMALAGAIVSVDPVGGIVVNRGLLRAEHVKAARDKERVSLGADEDSDSTTDTPERKPTISEKLVKRLSAHRTAALQAEVARNPQIALVALVHRLALAVIHPDYREFPIHISASPQDRLDLHADDIAEAPASVGMREVREAWQKCLPRDPQAMFATLSALRQQELLALLAVCVALTVSDMASREDDTPAALLAKAVGLDMHAWWTPTTAGYFDHVTKSKALEAVQVFAPCEVKRLEKLKKMEIAKEAGRLAVGTGWLPEMLRVKEDAPADQADDEPVRALKDSPTAQDDAAVA